MSVTQEDGRRKGGQPDEPPDKLAAREPADGEKPGKEKTVTVTVGEKQVVTPRRTTPRDLMIKAGLDPDERQLVRVKGKHQESFEDPDQQITVHEGEKFITVSTGNTPVS